MAVGSKDESNHVGHQSGRRGSAVSNESLKAVLGMSIKQRAQGATSSKMPMRRGGFAMLSKDENDPVKNGEAQAQFSRFISEHVFETFADDAETENAAAPSESSSRSDAHLDVTPFTAGRNPPMSEKGVEDRVFFAGRRRFGTESTVSVDLPEAPEIPQQWVSPTDDNTVEAFEKDYDLRKLRAHVTDEFKDLFSEGLSNYLAGDWVQAKINLENADEVMARNCPALGGDNPSRTLIKYMEQYGFVAPRTWKSYRPLISK
jgi:hypothetical protein